MEEWDRGTSARRYRRPEPACQARSARNAPEPVRDAAQDGIGRGWLLPAISVVPRAGRYAHRNRTGCRPVVAAAEFCSRIPNKAFAQALGLSLWYRIRIQGVQTANHLEICYSPGCQSIV